MPNTSSHWTVDHPVALTATVAPSSGTAYVPYSGSVTFTDYVGSITGCSSAVAVNATTGVATCTATALTAGSHNIYVTYAGDTNYNGSTSSTLANPVDKAATTTVVTSSSSGNHSTVNDSVTFTATVAPNPVPSVANELAISGSVAFYMDGSSTPISGCSGALSSYSTSTGIATATCTTTSLTAAGSPHSIVARYAGDLNYNGSDNSAAPMSQTVSALAATIGVTPSPSSSTNVNTSVTFTAQLASAALSPIAPNGTVMFLVNGSTSPDCPAKTVSASGSATCTTARLPAGSNSIAATYSGDSNYTVATAGTATQTVSALAATLGLTASPSSSTMVNDSVTFTAQLAGVAFTPVVPSGKINFTANGSTITSCGAVAVNSAGLANCTTSMLAAGSDPITATYTGDSNFTVATQGAAIQTVTVTTATTAAIASLNYSPSSQTVLLSATVTSGSGTVNVGTVTFTIFNGGSPVGVATVSGTVTSGAASATYPLPAGTVVGPYTIQAVYNASAPFATSSDSTHSLTVNAASQTISFTAPATPVVYGVSPITLVATGGSSGNAVVFSVVSGPGTVSGSTLTITGVGTVVVASNQAGNANYTAATQATQSIVVNKPALTVTVNPATGVYGVAFPAFTGTLSGVVAGDGITATYSTTATPTSPAGGSYTITATLIDPNSKLGNYSVTNTPAALTITKATPNDALAASANTILTQNTETLTATVSSSVSVPTGSVNFLDGTTLLSTVPLTNGVAMLGTAALSIGSHSITAVYSGDCNFVSLTSAAQSITVQDFNLAISVSSGSASVTNATVMPGGTAVYTFMVSPVGSTTFPAAVTLSVSGLPTGATATFSPSILAAGSGSTNVTLTIQLPATTSRLQPANRLGRGLAPFALALLLLPFAGRMRRAGRKLGRGVSLVLLLLLGLGATVGLTGCGSSDGYFIQPQQTYTLTVTGTSGTLLHSTTVTLTVE